MRTRTTKLIARVFALLLIVSVLSSCNRGAGCPYSDFKAFPTITMPFTR